MHGRTYRLTNPWGDNSLADADAAYAAAVAELYEYSPDDEWLATMRDSVHRSMDFMLQQRYDSPSGMFVNDITSCTSKKSLREWNDAFYVKWQSGYVNELMYRALSGASSSATSSATRRVRRRTPTPRHPSRSSSTRTP